MYVRKKADGRLFAIASLLGVGSMAATFVLIKNFVVVSFPLFILSQRSSSKFYIWSLSPVFRIMVLEGHHERDTHQSLLDFLDFLDFFFFCSPSSSLFRFLLFFLTGSGD
jgi:hypothetical protein